MSMIRTPISTRPWFVLHIISVVFILASYFSIAYYQNKVNPDNTTMPTVKLFAEGFKNIFSPRIDRSFLPDGTSVEVKTFAKWLFSLLTPP